jgi:ribosomal protein S18 acetylase RimI-like enzyme
MRPNIELSKELLDQVIFGMENQDQIFFLDLDHLKVFSSSELEAMEPGGDLVEIPEWRSVDGYNLMERFVAELKNPLVKLELQQILSSGRGVFRQFKNCLKEHREVEKLWFFYKDRQMKQLVLDWFNGVRESRGLEALKPEIFEGEDLVLSDFTIRQVEDEAVLQTVKYLDRRVFAEIFPDPEEAAYWYSFRRDHIPGVDELDNGSYVLGVFQPDGEICGFLWILHDEITESRSLAHILQIYVEARYRGLGIATTLIDRYLDIIKAEDIEIVTLENWSGSSYLSDMLERIGFAEYVRLFALDRRR